MTTTTTTADPGLPQQIMDVTTDRGGFRIEQPSGRLLAATATAPPLPTRLPSPRSRSSPPARPSPTPGSPTGSQA
ncbi:hypothetical protein [Kitasatospora sp. NPDC093102]|uniref:hypothetical protein n=1 Tax=Kitasatospora sp. NPDC093102 TaxID=3155069 RepID=UPI00341E37C1